MKIYPYPKSDFRQDGGFTADEMVRGIWSLRTDVQCEDCKRWLPLAVAGSTDNGKCDRCGGETL